MISCDDIVADDFKAWFKRDFTYKTPYGALTPRPDCSPEYITDEDIEKAYIEARASFNDGLFSEDAQLKAAFLYLSAHFLVCDLQSSLAGTGSSGNFPVASRSVGGVSESYAVPKWVSDDPFLGDFATTRYGQRYLAIIKPLLIGNVVVYQGATTYR